MRAFASLDELESAVGTTLGESSWRTVTQDDIDAFAEVTGDRQWIHIDRERGASGPYRTTIAHGFLVLSLLPALLAEVWRVAGVAVTINYGLDRVRFLDVVEAGAQIRASATLTRVLQKPRGVLTHVTVTVEKRGGAGPVCIAESLALRVPERVGRRAGC